MDIKKGKYEIFIVGNEKVISKSRDKIKQYAKSSGINKIDYVMSVDNIDGIKGKTKYID